jgi:hypothetical protein
MSTCTELENKNIPGIYPIPAKLIGDVFKHELDIKAYLEARSGYMYDMEAVRYMIESARLDGRDNESVYGFAVRTGMATSLRIK